MRVFSHFWTGVTWVVFIDLTKNTLLQLPINDKAQWSWQNINIVLKSLLESIMVFDKLEPKLLKTLLKALAISVGFVISLPFTLTMFGWTLLLDFTVISYRIPFHIKVVLLPFLSKSNLKYSFLHLLKRLHYFSIF